MLRNRIKNAIFITFPDYESESGGIISRYLKGEFGDSFEFGGGNAYGVSSFYAVDRFISCSKGWGQAYRKGANVICARYTSSNAIYQMAKLPRDDWESYLDWLQDYEHGKLKIPRPDLTLYLDLPVETSRELLNTRSTAKDIHESDEIYRQKCKDAALFVCEREGWTKINCMEVSGGVEVLRAPTDINEELVRNIANAGV
jgi:dTMP kinase